MPPKESRAKKSQVKSSRAQQSTAERTRTQPERAAKNNTAAATTRVPAAAVKKTATKKTAVAAKKAPAKKAPAKKAAAKKAAAKKATAKKTTVKEPRARSSKNMDESGSESESEPLAKSKSEKEEVKLPAVFEELIRKKKYPSPYQVGRFLAGYRISSSFPYTETKPYRRGCKLAEAKRLLKVFPLQKVVGQYGKSGYNVYNYTAMGLNVPDITRAIAQEWSMNNEARLQAMKMVLDQGADPDSCEVDIGGISSIAIRGTALAAARKRGDTKMVDLLLRRGARDVYTGKRL